MTQTKYIQGAGGGNKFGGDNNGGTEADDTLQSVQFANVLDLISEGEIQGLEDGNKSIFLDDTPVQNPDGTNNFSGYTVVRGLERKRKRTFQGRSMPWSVKQRLALKSKKTRLLLAALRTQMLIVCVSH